MPGGTGTLVAERREFLAEEAGGPGQGRLVEAATQQEILDRARAHRFRRNAAVGQACMQHPARLIEAEREHGGDDADVVALALGHLVRSRSPRLHGNPHGDDQFVVLAHGLAVAGEEGLGGHRAPATRTFEIDLRIEGEQDGQQVADRRGRAEIAAQGRPVAHLARGEPAQHLVERRDSSSQGPIDRAKAGPGTDDGFIPVDDNPSQRLDAIERNPGRGIDASATEFDPEVGCAGDPARSGMVALEGESRGDVGRQEISPERSCRPLLGRALQDVGKAVATGFHAGQGVGRAADRRIAGAAAQVAFCRRIVEFAGVEAGKQAHDEPRRAVSALRTRSVDEGALDRMQVGAVGQMLDRDDLAPAQRAERQQAAVDRPVVAPAVGIRFDHGHRAGPAIPVGAAFLGAGQGVPLEPAQQRLGGRAVGQGDAGAIEPERDFVVHDRNVAHDASAVHA